MEITVCFLVLKVLKRLDNLVENNTGNLIFYKEKFWHLENSSCRSLCKSSWRRQPQLLATVTLGQTCKYSHWNTWCYDLMCQKSQFSLKSANFLLFNFQFSALQYCEYQRENCLPVTHKVLVLLKTWFLKIKHVRGFPNKLLGVLGRMDKENFWFVTWKISCIVIDYS